MVTLHQYLENNKAVIELTSFEECFEIFNHSGKLSSARYYFRGQPNSAHKLQSSLDRVGAKSKLWHEAQFIASFKKAAMNYLPPGLTPTTTFEWLCLMQHFGVPTRLLDFTKSPYVGLYFATSDFHEECDASIWAINPGLLHEGASLFLKEKDFPLPIEQPHFHNFSNFIQEPYFAEAFLSDKYRFCAVLEPAVAEKRLLNQQGAFLVAGGSGDTEETLSEVLLSFIYSRPEKYVGGEDKGFWDWNLVKVIIPSRLKKKIFSQLQSMNINALTLFPDLFGVARYAKESVLSFRAI